MTTEKRQYCVRINRTMLKINTVCVLTGVFVILSSTIPTAQPAACTYRQTVGSGDTSAASVNSPDPVDNNITVLMANSMGTVQCCGVVIAWELFVEGSGFISLQVWRPVQEEVNRYMLLGANGNRHRSAGISQVGRVISDRNSIHVVPGDILGFVQREASILRYTTCNPALPTEPHICADDLFIYTSVSELSAGDVVEFISDQSSYLGTNTVRGYAVTAYLDEKNPVTCTDKHTTISDTLNVGAHVTNAHADNMDLNHPDSSFVIDSMSPSLPVTMDPRTGEITVSGKLSPAYPSTDYVLTVGVMDVCSSTSTCNVTVTVRNVPKPITFIALPANVELSDLTKNREVYEFEISPQRDVDLVTCYISSTLPHIRSYEVKNKSKTDFGVHLVEVPDTNSILESEVVVTVLLIACENTEGKYNQSTLTLTYKSEGRGLGILLTIVGIIITLVVLALVTVLLSWLCNKGKVKVWPSNDLVGKTDTTKKGQLHQQDKTSIAIENKDQHKDENGNSKTGQLWDNFSSLYKVERFTSGRVTGDWDNRITKSHNSVLISQQQLGRHEGYSDFGKYSNFHSHVLQKKPWRP